MILTEEAHSEWPARASWGTKQTELDPFAPSGSTASPSAAAGIPVSRVLNLAIWILNLQRRNTIIISGLKMPISRSTTLRDNSRSPAPPPIPNPSTPRPFLPPVHYDVASGYTTRHLKNDMGHPSTSNIKNRPKEEVKRNHSRGLAGVQAPPEASNSESSLKSATEEWSPQSNAQKRRSGFPDIEAQLLPSLRDTIDRMTLAPSRASTPFKTRSPSESARENHTQKRRSSPDLRTPTLRKGTRHPDSRELTKYNVGDGEPLTPNPSNFYSNESTPTLGNYSSKLKTPAKSALKNSLRSPASTMGPPLPSSPAASAHSTTAGSSLRTVKSLLSRKVSGSFRSPFNGSRASREAKKNVSRF
jgi:hypothetical protein